MGNPGIDVFSTPALVGLLDALAHQCLVPTLGPGQGTVGTRNRGQPPRGNAHRDEGPRDGGGGKNRGKTGSG